MLDIPVVTVNEHSPYQVSEVEHNSFMFITQYGIRYNVGFAKDTILSEDEGFYHFYILNMDHSHFRHDPLLYETIEAIIRAFFQNEHSVMLYLCDNLDGRQSTRNRLFQYWFDRYPNKDLYTFVNKNISYGDICYYGAMILKKSHPEHDIVVERFIRYIDNLEDKIR